MKKLPLDIQFFSTGSGATATATKECIYNEQGICESVKVTISSSGNIYMIFSSAGTNVTTDWGLTSQSESNGNTATKTFTSNMSIVLEVGIGTNDRNAESVDVNIDITEIGSEQETTYVYCKSKCKHPLVMQSKTLVDSGSKYKVEVFRIGNVCHLVGYTHSNSVTINSNFTFNLPEWAKPSVTLESFKNEGSYGTCFLRASNTTSGAKSCFIINIGSDHSTHHYNCITYYVE